MRPIPQFKQCDHRLFVTHSGFIEGVALYEGNELIVMPFDRLEQEMSILLLKNNLTGRLCLGGFYGEQLIVFPSHNPIPLEHWQILGRIVAVQRSVKDALLSSTAWHVAHKDLCSGRLEQRTCGSVYLSELARLSQDESDVFIASEVPLTPEQHLFIDQVPAGHIWFLFPQISHQPIEASISGQAWTIRRRYRNYHAWKLRRPRQSANVLSFPLEIQDKKFDIQDIESAKLASK